MRVMKSIVLTLALCNLLIGCNTGDTESAPRWPRSIEPRLSGSQWRPCRTKTDCGPTTLAQVACKDVIVTVRKARQLLLTQPGCTSDAVKALEGIALSHPEAYNDLAAAYYVRAQREDRPADLLNAFDAVAKAPRSPESLFNRALIEEALYLRDDAIASWNELLKVDRTQWAAEARAHRNALARQVDGVTQWQRNQVELMTAHGDQARALLAPFPNSATKWFEQHPSVELAPELSGVTKDRYPIDVANAAHDTKAQEALARAREAAAALKPHQAAEAYEKVSTLFARSDSPVALSARMDYASLIGLNSTYQRTLELLDQLEPQIQRRGYEQLEAKLHAARANALYWSGQPVEALLEDDKVFAEYRRLGNEEGAAATLARRAGVYRVVGAGRRGWRDVVDAFRREPHLGTKRDQQALWGEAATSAVALGHPLPALSYINGLMRRLRKEDPEYVSALSTRATIELVLGRTTAAAADLNAANVVREAAEDATALRILRARTEEIGGRTLIKEANVTGAVAAFTRALDHASPEFPTFRATIFSERAEAYRLAGSRPQATSDLMAAAKELDKEESGVLSHRTRGRAEEIWSAYFSRFQNVYQALIREYISQNRIAGALSYAERARAAEPLSLATAKPFDRVALQRALPPGTVLLEYAVLDDRTIVWIIRPERVDAMTLDAPRAKVAQWTAAVQGNNATDIGNALKAAHHDLIEPALAFLGGVPPRLVFIPDREMQGLPFAALHDSNSGRYLIERRAV